MPSLKGFSRARRFRSEKRAKDYVRKQNLRRKFRQVRITEGTHKYGGGVGKKPKKQKVFTVWVK